MRITKENRKFKIISNYFSHLPECIKINLIYLNLIQLHYVPMSIAKLNERRFVPYKDFDKDRLVSGCLQLPDATQLVVDETKLETGQLNEIGWQV